MSTSVIHIKDRCSADAQAKSGGDNDIKTSVDDLTDILACIIKSTLDTY